MFMSITHIHSITKDPNEKNCLLVFSYTEFDDDLSKNFKEITWKYKIDELIDELSNLLNELINKDYLRITNLSSELYETLKIMENCVSCKCDLEKDYFYGFYRSINEVKYHLVKLEREEQGKGRIIENLDRKLIYIDNKLNEKVLLCEGCKEKKIEKLTDKCDNEEIARLVVYVSRKIMWIPFNEFRDIRYLAEGGFAKVYKATWIKYDHDYKEIDVVLKRIYNSNNKILDALKEV